MIEVKHFFQKKYERPTTVATLLDTGTPPSSLNPIILQMTVLPDNMGKNHQKLFQVANNVHFIIELISKLIKI